MTAVLSILNKTAVAISADSAVTISGPNGNKIFNKANKIFTLSKRYPVGLALFSSPEFMTVPWEIIIKMYRKDLADKYFDKLKQYQENFIDYILHNENVPKSNEENDVASLKMHLINILQGIHFQKVQEFNSKGQILTDLNQEINEYLKSMNPIEPLNELKLESFTDYNLKDFNLKYKKYIEEIIESLVLNNSPIKLNDHSIEKLVNLVFNKIVLKSNLNQSPYTGLVFVGYGESEIYPHIVALEIGHFFDGRLPINYTDSNYVTGKFVQNYGVYPFAQIDVINTIVTGMDPFLEQQFALNTQKIFEDYHKNISGILQSISPELGKLTDAIPITKFLSTLNNINQKIKQERFINPLLAAINILSKEDLAEMAESMIYLTYLKRRMTNSEESVGGPVDVAIISKGDGFVWIKRKHYFRPELNQCFFNNYFK